MKILKIKVLLLVVVSTFKVLAQDGNRVFMKKLSRWENYESIPVCWENPKFENFKQRKWVEEAITESWQKVSGLNFSCWCPCSEESKGIRILIKDDHPSTKFLGNKLNGVKNGVILNFDFFNFTPIKAASRDLILNKYQFYIKSIAMHEFGHAIGFSHDQNQKGCNTCGEEIQGEIGDIISPCDLSSIMNYCNPLYNNNGELSEGDKKGARAIYGAPLTSNRASSKNSSLSLFHNSTESNSVKNHYDATIFLLGTIEDLADVISVKYIMPAQFKQNSNILSIDKSSNFSLGMVTNDEYTIDALVTLKDSSTINLTRFIDLKLAEKGVIEPKNNFIIKATYEKIENEDTKYNFNISIDEASALYFNINRVEYFINEAKLDLKTLESDNEINNYGIDWDGDKLLKIPIKVFYQIDDNKYYTEYEYQFNKATEMKK